MRIRGVLAALRRELRDFDRFVESLEAALAVKQNQWQMRQGAQPGVASGDAGRDSGKIVHRAA